ncbi:hypothetical protein CROQUDRAFT_668781 [Cronartium quercuum f. sp. fusiforme G11]|uniref:Uncharacterized protein n=1 Tax=Cronartium quercuum f. sp. fusiforme G11 TaxID=708437 RepID=A0A9P6TFM4_9BASI|nr:hypothetical protein CROQUDRAFT_668781 [Cronartium quercuum f. sp. fusiforme G11]
MARSLVVPEVGKLFSFPQVFRTLYNDFEKEINFQNNLIDTMSSYLIESSVITSKEFDESSRDLVNSQLRRGLYRIKMVDYVPLDKVVDNQITDSLLTFGSRYTEEIIHSARELKTQNEKDPGDIILSLELLEKIKEIQSKLEAVDKLMFTISIPDFQKNIAGEEFLNIENFKIDYLATKNDMVSVEKDKVEFMESDDDNKGVQTFETSETESSVIRTSTTSVLDSTETVSETIINRSERIISWD